MYVTLLIFSATFVFVVGSNYEVPEPTINVYPHGFRVSIPDEDGVELFAFHGNINNELEDLHAGYYSKDILNKCGDQWVFEGRVNNNNNLKVGDTIYFWLFVQKNRLGYRYDNGKFVVTDILPELPALKCAKTETKQSNDCHTAYDLAIDVRNMVKRSISSEVSLCCELYSNVTYSLVDAARENALLKAQIEVLVTILKKDEYLSKTLKIFGHHPTNYYLNPQSFVQVLIKEKLHLSDIIVTEARTIPDDGVSFKVETLEDKIKIILAAENGLDGSNYELAW